MPLQDADIVRNTMRTHRICVIVPTFNNAGTIGRVLDDVLRYAPDVIVVNDGCTDSTSDVLRLFGDRIEVVSYGANRGKGAALKAGFKHALERGFEYAITIDSDGQHYADDIPLFVKAVVESPDSLIVGARDLSKVDINGKSSFANKFSNFWFRVQTGRNLPDTQTGYRAYPLKKLHGLNFLTSRYEAELELLVLAAWHDVKIVSIPIRVYYPPQAERVSHFKPALDFTRISVLNTVLCVAAVVYGLPVRTVNRLKNKNFFNREFSLFTRSKGQRRDASLTLGRIGRSLYGLSFFLFWTLGAFIPYVMVSKIGSPSESKRLRLHKMLNWISRTIVRLLPATKIEIRGAEKFHWDKPSMIVCNHQSHLDLPLIMSLSPKLVILTKDWVWNNPLIGPIAKGAEYLPVSMGAENLIPHLEDLKRRGYSVVVFPEGTRSENDDIQRFHQGAFYLAQALGMDIMPVVIHGVGNYQRKSDSWFRRGPITLTVLDTVPQSALSGTLLRKQASELRKIVYAGYREIAAEKETAAYFAPLVKYRYVYRGWKTVAACKRVLHSKKAMACVDSHNDAAVVWVLNSGVGAFAMLYALTHKQCEVYAFEEDFAKHSVAVDTAGIPSNLHFIHSVWSNELPAQADCDLAFCLEGPMAAPSHCKNIVKIPLDS